MSDTDRYTTGPERLEGLSTSPSGLMDLLGVAAVLLEGDGRVDMWSPQAEELFGYTAEEAVGRYAAHLLVHDAHRKLVVRLFAEVMRTGESWAGSFPRALQGRQPAPGGVPQHAADGQPR